MSETPIDYQLLAIFAAVADAVVMEMHPEIVNVGELVQIICNQGFDYRDSYETTKGYQRSKRERLFVRQEI